MDGWCPCARACVGENDACEGPLLGLISAYSVQWAGGRLTNVGSVNCSVVISVTRMAGNVG